MSNVNIKVNLITKAAELQLQKLNSQLGQTNRAVGNFSRRSTRSVDTLSRSFRNASIAFGNFGILLRAGAVGGGLFALSQGVQRAVKDFADFERALVGVSKTTNLSGVELERFGREIQELARRVPVSTNELLRLSQVAAQLGIRGTRNLQKFAEVGARLGVSTDLAAEEAVTALTRIIGVTRGSQEDIDNLGASLVELGNTFKAQESEILTAAGRVARATAGFGLAAQDTLAIGAALKEAGVEAESGGSAIGRIFQEIDESIANGGEQLRLFSQLTGLTSKELKDSLAKDAAGTFKLFIDGVRRSVDNGQNLTNILRGLELGNVRVAATVRSLVQINDRLGDSFNTSSNAFKNNTALLEESNKQFNTLSGRIQLLETAFNQLFSNIGENAQGVINDFVKGVTEIVNFAARVFAPDTIAEQIEKSESRLKSLKVQLDLVRGSIELSQKQGQPDYLNNEEVAKEADLLRLIREEEIALRELRKTPVPEPPTPKIGGATKDDGTQNTNSESQLIAEAERLRTLREQIFLQEQEQRFAQDGVITDQEKLKLMTLADLNATARENEFLEQRKAFLSAKKLQELQLKNELEQQKRKTKIVKSEQELREAERQATLSSTADLFGSLAQLTATGGKRTFAITKALQKAQIVTSGIVGVQNALAGPPTGPPYPANIIQAAAIGATTAANLIRINSQQPPSFQTGGIVPGNSTTGDRVLARVNSDEMILTRAQQAELFAIANGAGPSGSQPIQVNNTTTLEVDGQTLARAVSREVANGVKLGEFE